MSLTESSIKRSGRASAVPTTTSLVQQGSFNTGYRYLYDRELNNTVNFLEFLQVLES